MGQRRSLAESRPFPGIPDGVVRGSIPGRLAASTQSRVPSVPGKIPGGMTSCPTPVGRQAEVVLLRSFVYTRSARCSVYTRSNLRFVHTRSNLRFVYTRGWCILTHTSVRGAASAWAADIRPSSDCDGVCVTAVVRGVVWEMTLAVASWYRLSPIL